MTERSPMLFCSSCGTVSSVEGECPQCSVPFKRLGRVGSITESKRNTQMLINNENIKNNSRPMMRQNSREQSGLFSTEMNESMKSSTMDGGVAKAYLNMIRNQQQRQPSTDNTAHSPRQHSLSTFPSPSTGEYSPRQHPLISTSQYPLAGVPSPALEYSSRQAHRMPSMPLLISPKLRPQLQQSLDRSSTSMQPLDSASEPTTDASKASPNKSQQKSYLTSAFMRFSQVFKKNKSAQSEAKASEDSGYTSAPDLTPLSVTPTLENERTFRRRSSIDIRSANGAANTSSPQLDSDSDSSLYSPVSSPACSIASNDSYDSDVLNSPRGSDSPINPPAPLKTKPITSPTKANTGGSSTIPSLVKAKSTLNINFNTISKPPFTYAPLPPQTLSLHIPTSSPTSPFSDSKGSKRIPPNRPLPSIPPNEQGTVLRRNTVHSDTLTKPTGYSPPVRELPSEWFNFTRSPKTSESAESPKGEVSVLLPSKVELYFHRHIPEPPSGLSTDEMREKIAQELITTEYEYVNDLYTLVSAKKEMEQFVHKNELSSIFNNIDQIYNVNEAIYKKILGQYTQKQHQTNKQDDGSTETQAEFPSADEKVTAICRTFLVLSHTLKIYVKYSLGHQRAFEKLKLLMETDEYGALLKQVAAMPGFKGQEMSGYLIKPVQRICRYPLLLKEIAKSTPAGHSTLSELQDALVCVEETIVEINEAQRAIERELNLMRAQHDLNLLGMDIDVMSPTRILVLDGPMRLVPMIRKAKTTASKVVKKPKQGHYFLFDDFFLFVMDTKKKETPHIFIPTDQTLVTDPGENALEIIHAGKDIWMFILPSYHDKVFLMQKLNQIIEDILGEAKNRNSFRESGKSTLNIATLSRRQKTKRKKGRDISDIFGLDK